MATKTLNQNINQAINDFKGVKQAIIDKGVEIPSGTPTSEYGAKISEIQSGGSGGLDTSGITNFNEFCINQRIPIDCLGGLDTRSGTDFSYMFSGSSGLTTIPQLDTSNGTNFGYMFYNCTSLTTVPQLDTSNGTDFSYMFSGSSGLTTVPQLGTSNGTNFERMFSGCSSLTTIPQLDTSKSTNFTQMFLNCSSLAEVPQLNTSKGTAFERMFEGCKKLTEIPSLDTSKASQLSSTFRYCYELKTVELTSFAPTQYAFDGCRSLENLTVTGTITINGNNYLDLSDSTLLTVDSLLSVLNALADNTGKTTRTITLGSTNLAKLTDEQKAIATNKNYTLK